MAEEQQEPGVLTRAGSAAAERAREGLTRVRGSILQTLQLTVAAVGAYAFAERVLGHHDPIFAATAATVALGFAKGGVRYRRVLEVAVGCTLGIAVAEVMVAVLGTGIWQSAVVVMTSVLLARFLDRGVLFATQMALQSLLVVVLPPAADGAFARSTDAMIGGGFALLMVYLVPSDPRRQPRQHVRQLAAELSTSLREAGDALAADDRAQAWHALVRARHTQKHVDAVDTAMSSAQEITTAAPVHRRHRSEVDQIGHSIRCLDLAARNARVLVRRLAGVLSHVTLAPEAVESLSEALADMGDAVTTVGSALSVSQTAARQSYLRQARTELTTVAGRLEPRSMGGDTLEGQTLVLLMRPLVVDLLEACNMSHDEAISHLPPLDEWDRA